MSIMPDFFLELKSENQNVEKVVNGSFQITLQHYARMINFIISNGELNAPRFSSMIGYTVYSDVTSFTPESDATYLMSAQAGTGEWRYSYFIKPVDNMHVFFDKLKYCSYS